MAKEPDLNPGLMRAKAKTNLPSRWPTAEDLARLIYEEMTGVTLRDRSHVRFSDDSGSMRAARAVLHRLSFAVEEKSDDSRAFPRLKSAGLRGAKAIGDAQMTSTEKTSEDHRVVASPRSRRGRIAS